MELTAGQLTEFLESRRKRIALLVSPADVGPALEAIGERIRLRLPEVPDEDSLDSLLRVEAIDFALRPLVTAYCGAAADDDTIRQLFAWREGLIEAEIRKTLHFQLSSKDENDVNAVLEEVKTKMWQARLKFDPAKLFIPWARGIAKNAARTFKRFDGRLISLDGEDSYTELPSKGPSPEDFATASERLARVWGPTPKMYDEVLRLACESAPHQVLAFLFNRYLRIKPARIVQEIGDLSLTEALGAVTKSLRENDIEIPGLDGILAPVVARVKESSKKFREFTLQNSDREIGEWAWGVHRAVAGKIVQLGKKFLGLLCELRTAACEITTFLWIRLLYTSPLALSRMADRDVPALIEVFNDRYARRELLRIDQIESATMGLRRSASKGRTLGEYGGSDLYGSFKRWTGRVGVLAEEAATGANMLGYAWITGLLTEWRKSA